MEKLYFQHFQFHFTKFREWRLSIGFKCSKWEDLYEIASKYFMGIRIMSEIIVNG